MEETIKLSPWGNSSGVRLSKKMLGAIGIDNPDNQLLDVKVNDGKIEITKAKDDYTLADMFVGFDTDAYFAKQKGSLEYDWGKISTN